MKITKKTMTTLEFDRVRDMLADCAMTDGSRALAQRLEPSDDIHVVLRRLRHTTDARRMCDAKGMPSFGMVKDVGGACERAEKGAVLNPRELLDIAAVLRTARTLQDYGTTNTTFETSLDEMFERLIPNRHLETEIERAIPAEDMIADEASQALATIRRNMRAANNRIKEILHKYISGGSYSKYLQDNLVTTRDGRYVVPVRAECRGDVPGLLHDTSASGATLFIEPMPVVEANNELRLLHAKEEREIERILAELSAKVSEAADVIDLNYRNITELAFIFACGELSSRMRGIAPMLTGERTVKLLRARHPLIDKNSVVPINVSLGAGCGEGGGYDTLIITGPNTGGKTVTLKTLGLFALMVQSGLHIPADEPSQMCLFDRILVDLGDEQSIEQSLSTFSSHMVNIVSILRQLTDRSLVLFDELGGGTDPVEGAALAVAIIESVREAGAMCGATTHYAELKAYALSTPGVCNASCEFDVETLKPTYKLIIGTPGKSNAFAISTKLGLPDAIVARAQEYISADNKQFEDVIEQLERSRIAMEKEREAAKALREEYETFKKNAEKQINKRLGESEVTLNKAREKAQAILTSAKVSSDYILEQADKVRRAQETDRLASQLEETRRNVRAYLRENEDKINPVDERRDENYVLPRALRKGDEVYLMDIGKQAVVISDPDRSGNVMVKAGIITTKTKVKNLKLVENTPTLITEDKKQKKVSDYRAQISHDFKPEIDLRGMTGEEAWGAVDKYLDEAQMHGIKNVSLIHGKGTGALKAALWRFLKGDKRLASFRQGQFGEGDGGVTVVELK
ncbi:MAG: endonuclease MutS2 [Ruminococcaceae bacterium]|nr:endonuclease MutS2 [Oscillospiraceae bacterium]